VKGHRPHVVLVLRIGFELGAGEKLLRKGSQRKQGRTHGPGIEAVLLKIRA